MMPFRGLGGPDPSRASHLSGGAPGGGLGEGDSPTPRAPAAGPAGSACRSRPEHQLRARVEKDRHLMDKMGRILGFLSVMVLDAGCAGNGPPSVGIAHLYPASVDRTWSAIEQAMADLDLLIEEDSHDDQGGMLRARRAATGNPILVLARGFELETTEVSVGVPPDDRDLEQAIRGRIESHLKSGVPAMVQ